MPREPEPPSAGHVELLHSLREQRQRLGLTQAELARLAGVSQALVARMESANPKTRIDPRLSTYVRVLRAMEQTEQKRVTASRVAHSPVLSAAADDTLEEVARVFERESISQMPVIQGGVQVGSVSDRAIARVLARGDPKRISTMRVRDVMEEPFPTVGPAETLETLSVLLERHGAVLVQEQGRVAGVITKHDVMGLLRK
ncbi:MAG: CBS domain-containing protein [Halobacteria archaeon]